LYNCLVAGNNSGLSADGQAAYNCTIVGNSVGVGILTGSCILYNCLVYSNTVNWQNNPVFHYCCTTPEQGGWEPGNITNDPQFVNYNAGNYHLSTDSPCVNTGTNFPWQAATSNDFRNQDMDGQRRILNGRVDMGVYEVIYEGMIFTTH
jgi:hypothetical protein